MKNKLCKEFCLLSEYQRLILQAECLEIKASKLLKYANKAREKAKGLIINE